MSIAGLTATSCGIGVRAGGTHGPDPIADANARAAGATDTTIVKGDAICKYGWQRSADGLLDDFEDESTQLALMDGRDGYWWTAHDSHGSTISEDLPPQRSGAEGSNAIHVTGTTVDAENAWGSGLGANLRTEGSYDASKYVGIAFKAKVGPISTKKFRLKIGDVNTHQDLGVCTDCWNHFGTDVQLSEEWQEIKVYFNDLKQDPGWGDPRPPEIAVTDLYNLEFSISTGVDFDLWVDDVVLIECRPQ